MTAVAASTGTNATKTQTLAEIICMSLVLIQLSGKEQKMGSGADNMSEELITPSQAALINKSLPEDDTPTDDEWLDAVLDEDMVNHPPHYTQHKWEVIDVLEEYFPLDPLLFNVGKYILRSPYKGNELQDLEKAAWYLNRKIAKLKASL